MDRRIFTQQFVARRNIREQPPITPSTQKLRAASGKNQF